MPLCTGQVVCHTGWVESGAVEVARATIPRWIMVSPCSLQTVFLCVSIESAVNDEAALLSAVVKDTNDGVTANDLGLSICVFCPIGLRGLIGIAPSLFLYVGERRNR